MECYQRGKELLGKGELEESCRALSDFIETQKRLQVPKNWEELVDAFNARGHIKYLWVDFDGAVEDYTEAIRRNPDFAVAYYNRGQIHYRLGKDQFDVVPGEHWVPSLIPMQTQAIQAWSTSSIPCGCGAGKEGLVTSVVVKCKE